MGNVRNQEKEEVRECEGKGGSGKSSKIKVPPLDEI